MPAKNKKQMTFYVSPEEKEAIDTLANGNRSEYLRSLIARDAQSRGVEWPDDTQDTRGQYMRVVEEMMTLYFDSEQDAVAAARRFDAEVFTEADDMPDFLRTEDNRDEWETDFWYFDVYEWRPIVIPDSCYAIDYYRRPR